MIASRAAMAGLKSVILIGAAIALSGQSQNWLTQVERTEASHVVGNPETKTQLTEWVSYTCPACANFSRNGEEVVKLAYVGP
ncbi:MAG: thioredoxin domain-containing protein, partial [Erythrobacter sp.]|nr:thioredoxin domain-containing protein [Erythrobacter sp.]